MGAIKSEQDAVDEIVSKWIDRRAFARTISAVGAGVLAAGAPAVHAQGVSDTDILNFALNLEYLEAEFYSIATSGRTIDQLGIPITGVGTLGPTTGVSSSTSAPIPF